MMKFTRLATLTALLLAINVQADDDAGADRILGIWATEKAESHIEISKAEDGSYTGTIIWLDEPFYPAGDEEGMAGQPKVDRENPDPELRDRAIKGLQIMHGFVHDDGQWEDGEIYDPESGNTYSSKIWLTKDGSLKVRGYVGISLFGRTTEWTPVLGVSDITAGSELSGEDQGPVTESEAKDGSDPDADEQ